MLPSLAGLEIGTWKRGLADPEPPVFAVARPTFFSLLINWPEHFKNLDTTPRIVADPTKGDATGLVLTYAIVIEGPPAERDIRVNLNVSYEVRDGNVVPVRVFVKGPREGLHEELCLEAELKRGRSLYTHSLLRERDAAGNLDSAMCQVWKVGPDDDRQGIGRALITMLTTMMSQVFRGNSYLSLEDASRYTARNCPLVHHDMAEYLAIKRGYGFYEALGYTAEHVRNMEMVEVEKAMNRYLLWNNTLFGTPIKELRQAMSAADRFRGVLNGMEPRAWDAVLEIETSLTLYPEWAASWALLSVRALLDRMERAAAEFDPRNGERRMMRDEAALLRTSQGVRNVWTSRLPDPSETRALLGFLNGIRMDRFMLYSRSLHKYKNVYKNDGDDRQLIRRHVVINDEGTEFATVPIEEQRFRLVGIESNKESVVPWVIRHNLFPNAQIGLPHDHT